ncbi:MAG: transcriptional regulator GcvA [Alphaproteobacteria bacterium]|nr:transcriptional regulator GcvA [Alphaproteobacteria bacterium]
MRDRLPSLRAIETFTEAARRLSFKLAGERLGLTASGVSRRIQALEADLGVKLFRRFNRALELTPAGRRYLARVGPAIDRIRDASRNLRGKGGERVRLSVLQSFAAAWLVPRLPDFLARHPDIEIELETGSAYEDFDAAGIAVGIRFGRGHWPGRLADRLMTIEAFPVASPALVRGDPPLREPADLARHTLLLARHLPDVWPAWLAAAGLPDLKPRRQRAYDNSQLLYQAAANGLGVALGVEPLIGELMREGKLVRPFRQSLKLESSYYLVMRPDERQRPAIRAFRNWILAAAKG